MNRGEFPQIEYLPEAKYRQLASWKRLMRVLGAVVDPAADLALIDGTELPD